MPQITFIEHNGATHEVDAAVGQSLMEAAVRANIPGILADCGGACACATCHVYVDPAWWEASGPAGAMEASMLDYAEAVGETSRLSCQIRISEAADGLVVRIPEAQG